MTNGLCYYELKRLKSLQSNDIEIIALGTNSRDTPNMLSKCNINITETVKKNIGTMKVYITSRLSWFFCLNKEEKIMHIPDNYLSPSTCAVMGAVNGSCMDCSSKKGQKRSNKGKNAVTWYWCCFFISVDDVQCTASGGNNRSCCRRNPACNSVRTICSLYFCHSSAC